MKGQGKVPKIQNFNTVKQSFEKIYSQSLSKYYETYLSTNSAEPQTSKFLPQINSDTDRNPHGLNSSRLPSQKKGLISEDLAQFSSKLQNNTNSFHQYLGSFRGDGWSNFDYEMLGQVVYDQSPGFFNRTISEPERLPQVSTLRSETPQIKGEKGLKKTQAQLSLSTSRVTDLGMASPLFKSNMETISEVGQKPKGKHSIRKLSEGADPLEIIKPRFIAEKDKDVISNTQRTKQFLKNVAVEKRPITAGGPKNKEKKEKGSFAGKKVQPPSSNKTQDSAYFQKATFEKGLPSFYRDDTWRQDQTLTLSTKGGEASTLEIDSNRNQSPILQKIKKFDFASSVEHLKNLKQQQEDNQPKTKKLSKVEKPQTKKVIETSEENNVSIQNLNEKKNSKVPSISSKSFENKINASRGTTAGKSIKGSEFVTSIGVIGDRMKVLSLANEEEKEGDSVPPAWKSKRNSNLDWSEIILENGQTQALLKTEGDTTSRKASQDLSQERENSENNRKNLLKKKFRDKALAVKIGARFMSTITKQKNEAKQQKGSPPPDASPMKRKNTGLPLSSFATSRKVGKTGSKETKKTQQSPAKVIKKEDSPSPPKTNNDKNKVKETKNNGATATSVQTKEEKETGNPNLLTTVQMNLADHIVTSPDSHSKTGKRSRRDSLKSPNHGSSKRRNSSRVRPNPNNPKSWFDFTNKRNAMKPKRLRSLRFSNESYNGQILVDQQTEFLETFDQTLKNAVSLYFNSSHVSQGQSQTQKDKEKEKDKDKEKDKEKRFKTLSSQHSRTLGPLEDLLKNELEDETTKYPSSQHSENEINLIGRHHTQPSQINHLYSASEMSSLEDNNYRNVPKKYPHKDGVFFIYINPPSEEGIEDYPSPMSEDSNRILDLSDNGKKLASDSPKILHYKFDVGHRKLIEEEPSIFESSNSYEFSTLNKVFRKGAEVLFQIDEVYKSNMENLNIKSQKLRIRSNFFSFVDKVIIMPIEKWARCELVLQPSSSQREEKIETAGSLKEQSDDIRSGFLSKKDRRGDPRISLTFRFKPEFFLIKIFPFRHDFLFFRAEDIIKVDEKDKEHEEEDFENDDTDQQKERMVSTNLIFSTGEEFSTIAKRIDFHEAKRVLTFKAIIVGFNFDSIIAQKIWKIVEVKKDVKLKTASSTKIGLNNMQKIIFETNEFNWAHVKKCLLLLYKKFVYGSFELRTQLKVCQFEKKIDPKTELEKKALEGREIKKRQTFVGGGQLWRTASNLKQILQAKEQAPPTLNLDPSPRDQNNISFLQSMKTVEIKDNIKEGAMKQAKEHSKTSVRPIDKKNTLRLSAVSVEKSNTTGFPKNQEGVLKTQRSKSKKNTAERIGAERLQIPTLLKAETRNTSSNSPPHLQDSKLDIVEEKLMKKHTTNFSLSPTSEQSGGRVKDDTGFFLGHQLTGHSVLERKRTKTREANFDRSLSIRKEVSYANKNPKKEDQLYSPLQPQKIKENNEENESTKRPILRSRKLETSPSPSPQPQIKSPRISRIDPKKSNLEYKLNFSLFDSIYANQYLELRELMTLYPKNVLLIRDEEMNTLLIAAAKAGHKEIVELFLGLGCDVNAINNQGNTALHLALSYKHFEVADVLVNSGAKQHIMNFKGKTAWDV